MTSTDSIPVPDFNGGESLMSSMVPNDDAESLRTLSHIKEFLVDPWVRVFEERVNRTDERFEAYVKAQQESTNSIAATLARISGTDGYVPRDEIDRRFGAIGNLVRWAIATAITAFGVVVAVLGLLISWHGK